MTRIFDQIIDDVIKTEGGYVDHPADRGGPTMYGITQVVARDNGYYGPMNKMPRTVAASIYYNRYIHRPNFDSVYQISATIGIELIDTGVNMGPGTAAIFLQRWLNAFGVADGDLFVDGKIGGLTLNALEALIKRRGSEGIQVLHTGLNSIQCARYLEIAERDHTQRAFVYGQVRARVRL